MNRLFVGLILALSNAYAFANTTIPVDYDDLDQGGGGGGIGALFDFLAMAAISIAGVLVVFMALAERSGRVAAGKQGTRASLTEGWALKLAWSAIVSLCALFPLAIIVKWCGGVEFVRETWLQWWAAGTAGFYWLRHG